MEHLERQRPGEALKVMIRKPLAVLLLSAVLSYSYIDSLFLTYTPPLRVFNSLAFSPELYGSLSNPSSESYMSDMKTDDNHFSGSSRLFLAHRYEYENRKYQVTAANSLLITLAWDNDAYQRRSTWADASKQSNFSGNIALLTTDTLRRYMRNQFFTEFILDYEFLPVEFSRRNYIVKNLEKDLFGRMIYEYESESRRAQAITNDLSFSFGAGKGRIENVTAVTCARNVLAALEEDSVLESNSPEAKSGLADLIVRLSGKSRFDRRDQRREVLDSIGSYLVSHGLSKTLPVKTVVSMVDAYDYFDLQPRHRGFRTALLPYFRFFEKYDSSYDHDEYGTDTLHLSSFPSRIMDLATPNHLNYGMSKDRSEFRHIQYGVSAYAKYSKPLSNRTQLYLDGGLAFGIYYMYPFSDGFHYQYPELTTSASATIKFYPNFRSTITQTLSAGYGREFDFVDFNSNAETPDRDIRIATAVYSLEAEYYISPKISLSGAFILGYSDMYDLFGTYTQLNSSISANANYFIF